jgi:hypothetical protein
MDHEYLETFLAPIRTCARYHPKLGSASEAGKTLAEFLKFYAADRFYHWVGLDSELMYAAHKTAGGMTSVYRQVGVGGERLFRRLLRDGLGLSEPQCVWSYQTKTATGRVRTIQLDGRVWVEDIQNASLRRRVQDWLAAASGELLLSKSAAAAIRGAVFEVRQGYKSADAKRQNADIANASSAYCEHFLPVMVLLSNQISQSVAERYVRSKWLLLRGTLGGGHTQSSYQFVQTVLGFDLAAFFSRHTTIIRREVEKIMRELLSAK